MLQSGGVLVKSPNVVWSGSTYSWPTSLELSGWWASYGQIYRRQLWVAVVVNKLASAHARLPLKVYEKTATGRTEVPDHPYAQLLKKPNEYHDPFFFWIWMDSTLSIYGEVFAGKVRDRGGRPIELLPMHPSNLVLDDRDPRNLKWTFDNGVVRITDIPPEDLFYRHEYNPDSIYRGLSRLEPLRSTLENEDAARRATSSFWRNGARPGVTLTHPKRLDDVVSARLKLQWDEITGGTDNTGKTVVLEEGMKAEKLMLTAEEAQYIETRKLNREEVCGAYDVPPPVVHILDHATFSNITEQMRSMYRDTMAPRLKGWESALETQLRGGTRKGASEPDFGEGVYAEFLLDEVLRGDFEVRADAYQKGINSGWLKPSEVRAKENLPEADGADQLFINSTMIPVSAASSSSRPSLPTGTVRSLMGRLSRAKSLEEIDAEALTAGLNGDTPLVLAELAQAKEAGLDVAGFRERLKQLEAS